MASNCKPFLGTMKNDIFVPNCSGNNMCITHIIKGKNNEIYGNFTDIVVNKKGLFTLGNTNIESNHGVCLGYKNASEGSIKTVYVGVRGESFKNIIELKELDSAGEYIVSDFKLKGDTKKASTLELNQLYNECVTQNFMHQTLIGENVVPRIYSVNLYASNSNISKIQMCDINYDRRIQILTDSATQDGYHFLYERKSVVVKKVKTLNTIPSNEFSFLSESLFINKQERKENLPPLPLLIKHYRHQKNYDSDFRNLEWLRKNCNYVIDSWFQRNQDFLTKLFRILGVFHLNDIYHHDIKGDNLALKKVQDIYKIRIIDFGFASTKKEWMDTYEKYIDMPGLYQLETQIYEFFKGNPKKGTHDYHKHNMLMEMRNLSKNVIDTALTPRQTLFFIDELSNNFPESLITDTNSVFDEIKDGSEQRRLKEFDLVQKEYILPLFNQIASKYADVMVNTPPGSY